MSLAILIALLILLTFNLFCNAGLVHFTHSRLLIKSGLAMLFLIAANRPLTSVYKMLVEISNAQEIGVISGCTTYCHGGGRHTNKVIFCWYKSSESSGVDTQGKKHHERHAQDLLPHLR
jgi:hypothetical protein